MSSALAEAIRRHTDAQGAGDAAYDTAVPGFVLLRSSRETMPNHASYQPALCVVAQGEKQVTFGDLRMTYGTMQMLVVSLALPAIGRITRASRAEPYLGLALALDTAALGELLPQVGPLPTPDDSAHPGVFAGDAGATLADCLVRLVRLLDTPHAVPVLAPAIVREIHFWLLTGPYARHVVRLAMPEGQTQRVAAAIRLLRDRFAKAIRVEELAAAAAMSPSSFHQHFKALTGMTPIQFQKQLRLVEARRLMVAGDANVATAAYTVGYESASQFSREYARMFGVPPKRDAMALRAVPA
ncbi:AraC family transcriptional regulator [Roseisolibacter sp. H3M3-2]|uniref:AraC family transcriptional regulator n=1 Tax=Roseisolibacter sp. H3M3-2 TaxID=3031323 RepID=UPI0023DBBBFC|nr:AraC family transcriptional regulator [Roseisolibacter sp. H3M3-2]MDF1502812.1 AraC family transcriptional regulator [Roseisolibacter sp. H3M3-2]